MLLDIIENRASEYKSLEELDILKEMCEEAIDKLNMYISGTWKFLPDHLVMI
jgi:hypothetical protein